MNIQKRLFELADEKYADFQAKLTPTIDRELFIGVVLPGCADQAVGCGGSVY